MTSIKSLIYPILQLPLLQNWKFERDVSEIPRGLKYGFCLRAQTLQKQGDLKAVPPIFLMAANVVGNSSPFPSGAGHHDLMRRSS